MNLKVFALLLIAVTIGLAACKKNSDAPAAVPPDSNINVINASASSVNLYLNGTRLTQSNLNPSGASGYFTVASGEQNYQVKGIFDPSTNTVKTLFNLPLKLDSNDYSLLFIAGATADKAFKVTDIFKTDTTANTAYVRFVNASPDEGTLALVLGSTKFEDMDFKAASDFKLVNVSSDPKVLNTIQVFRSGEPESIISGHVALLIGNMYTFYVKGVKDGTGNAAPGVGVILSSN